MTALLKSIQYSEWKNDPREWILDSFELNNINLIVGKNSTGKSRICNIISSLSDSIARGRIFTDGHWALSFGEGKNTTHKYELSCIGNNIISEKMTYNDRTVLHRESNGSGFIRYEKENRDIEFELGPQSTAAFGRRDYLQHPYLKPLHLWAENLRLFRFGTNLENNGLVVIDPAIEDQPNELITQPSAIFRKGTKKFGQEYIQEVISAFRYIGYDIEDIALIDAQDINALPNATIQGKLNAIGVKENGINYYVPQYFLSQGMWRALAIIINVVYLKRLNLGGTIVIDDIGEGLDYSRSTSIIKYLSEKINDSNMALIMTTNDRFVMNAIPLEFWHVAERVGNKVHVYNKNNSAERFDDFEYSGLNNFDFFAGRGFAGDLNDD